MLQNHPSQLLTRLPPAISFFSPSIQIPERKGKKKIGNTFFCCPLHMFDVLLGSLQLYVQKSNFAVRRLSCYPSLGRHQTSEVATEYLFPEPRLVLNIAPCWGYLLLHIFLHIFWIRYCQTMVTSLMSNEVSAAYWIVYCYYINYSHMATSTCKNLEKKPLDRREL